MTFIFILQNTWIRTKKCKTDFSHTSYFIVTRFLKGRKSLESRNGVIVLFLTHKITCIEKKDIYKEVQNNDSQSIVRCHFQSLFLKGGLDGGRFRLGPLP